MQEKHLDDATGENAILHETIRRLESENEAFMGEVGRLASMVQQLKNTITRLERTIISQAMVIDDMRGKTDETE